MPVLNTAHKLRLGTTKVDAVYAGVTKVWPPLVNMLSVGQATVEGADVSLAEALNYRLGGWTAPSNNFRVIRTHALDGKAALGVVNNLATGSAGYMTAGYTAAAAGVRFVAQAGRTYTLMAEGRFETAGRNWVLQLGFYDSAGALIGSVSQVTITGVAGQFVPGRLVAVAPAGAVQMLARLSQAQNLLPNQGETFYWRKVGLFEGDVQTSQWVSPAVPWAQNLFPAEHADVETNTITASDVKAGWRQGAGNVGVTQWVSGDGRHGTHSIAATVTAAASPLVQPRSSVSPMTNLMFPVTPGRAYTYLHSIKSSVAFPTSAGGQAIVRFTWYQADRTTLITTNDHTHVEPIPANTWVDFGCSQIAPAGAAWLYFNAYFQFSPAPAAGTVAQWDCFALYEGYAGAWFPP